MKTRAVLLIAVLLGLSALPTGRAEAATASWSFEPSSFDFGFRPPADGPTSAKAFQLRNTGETPLTPEFVAIVDRVGGGFKLAGNGCDHTLQPSTVCTIQVTFDPSVGGKKEATLTVETASSPVAAATAKLLGSGGEPIARVDPPGVVVFDPVTIPYGTPPGPGSRRTITVTNTGSAEMKIEGSEYREAAAPFPARTNFIASEAASGPYTCVRVVIPPGGSCAFGLEFSPRSPGDFHAEIELAYSDLEEVMPFSRLTIPLSGTAVAQPAPVPPPRPTPAAASLPRLVHMPPLRTTSRAATFVFAVDSSPSGNQCRSTRKRRFQACTSPTHLGGLKPGKQFFSVRAIGADGTPGPVTTYRWRVLPPRPARR